MNFKHSSTWRHCIVPSSREEKQHQLMSLHRKGRKEHSDLLKDHISKRRKRTKIQEQENQWRSIAPNNNVIFADDLVMFRRIVTESWDSAYAAGSPDTLGRIVQREIHREMGLRFAPASLTRQPQL